MRSEGEIKNKVENLEYAHRRHDDVYEPEYQREEGEIKALKWVLEEAEDEHRRI